MNEIWRQCTSPLGGDLIRRGPLVCDRTPFLYSGTPHCQPWLAELSGWDPFASIVLWCVFCQALRLWHLFGFFKMSHQSRSKFVQDCCINQICIIILCTHLDILGALLAYQTDGWLIKEFMCHVSVQACSPYKVLMDIGCLFTSFNIFLLIIYINNNLMIIDS